MKSNKIGKLQRFFGDLKTFDFLSISSALIFFLFSAHQMSHVRNYMCQLKLLEMRDRWLHRKRDRFQSGA
jgi:hypothetical protein